MLKILNQLNPMAIEKVCDIKSMCAYVKIETTFSFYKNIQSNQTISYYSILKSSYYEILLFTMKETKTNTTATADKKIGDCHIDILEKSKKLVRATFFSLKTYDQTGTYVFLKVFKKAAKDAEFECVQ